VRAAGRGALERCSAIEVGQQRLAAEQGMGDARSPGRVTGAGPCRTTHLSQQPPASMMSPPPLPADVDRLAILLDIDGTLLDLAPTPREIFVSRELRETLTRLWRRTGGAVAFVSGRRLSELDLMFAPLQLAAIGGHGAEIRLSSGDAPAKPRAPPLDADVKREFAAIAELSRGIVIEDKGYSLALHYRLAPEQAMPIHRKAEQIRERLSSATLELLPGKLMLEIKQTGFTKATAARELMLHPPFYGRRPIFIGDDITDLPMFALMPELAGIAISVGEGIPRADYHFENPSAVRHWLDTLSRHPAGTS
jgi:trehalose 6-phosphate phosphatase